MVRRKAGGTIYQWTLGFHWSPHRVARTFGHRDVLSLLLDRSPVDVDCSTPAGWLMSRRRAILQEHPALVASLSATTAVKWRTRRRNNESAAVRVMLECGWPVDATGQHQATPLHWAAFHGNAEMTATILRFGPPLEAIDTDFRAHHSDGRSTGPSTGGTCGRAITPPR